MEPYQERVIEEKKSLDEKTQLLEKFLNTPMCEKVAGEELARMTEQLYHMRSYSKVLGERIEAFV